MILRRARSPTEALSVKACAVSTDFAVLGNTAALSKVSKLDKAFSQIKLNSGPMMTRSISVCNYFCKIGRSCVEAISTRNIESVSGFSSGRLLLDDNLSPTNFPFCSPFGLHPFSLGLRFHQALSFAEVPDTSALLIDTLLLSVQADPMSAWVGCERWR